MGVEEGCLTSAKMGHNMTKCSRVDGLPLTILLTSRHLYA